MDKELIAILVAVGLVIKIAIGIIAIKNRKLIWKIIKGGFK